MSEIPEVKQIAFPIGESVTYLVTPPAGVQIQQLFFAVESSLDKAVLSWNNVDNPQNLFNQGGEWYLRFRPEDTVGMVPAKYKAGLRCLTASGEVKSFWPDGTNPLKGQPATIDFTLTGVPPKRLVVS